MNLLSLSTLLVFSCGSSKQEGEDSGGLSNSNNDISWGDIYPDPPQTFFASDLSISVQDGVDNALNKATEIWGKATTENDIHHSISISSYITLFEIL